MSAVVVAASVAAGASVALGSGRRVAVGAAGVARPAGGRWRRGGAGSHRAGHGAGLRGRRRRSGLAPGEVVAVLVALEASVGAGRSLPQALDLVARERPGVAGRDLAVVAGRVARGEPVVAALDRWAAARPGTGVDVAADAVAIASATGAPLGPALRTAAGGVRARAAAAREARALAASARASAAVLVAAPLAFAVAVAALDRSVRAYLVSTPAGWACLGLGLALDAVGARWMASMVEAVR